MTRGLAWRARALFLPMATVLIGATLVAGTSAAGALAPAGTALVSAATSGAPNHTSNPPSISGDGRYVAFASDASNLVASDTNGVTDVFRRDTQTGTTVRVSISQAGNQLEADSSNPAISADGRYVA